MIQLYNSDIKEFLTLKKNTEITVQFANAYIADKPSSSYDFEVVNDSVLAKSLSREKYQDSETPRDFAYNNCAHFYNANPFYHGDGKFGLTIDEYNKTKYAKIYVDKWTPKILLLNNGKNISEGYLVIIKTKPNFSKVKFVSAISRKLYEFFDNPQVNYRANSIPLAWLLYGNSSDEDYYRLYNNNLKYINLIPYWSGDSDYKHRNCTQASDGTYSVSWGTKKRLIYGQLKQLTDCVGVTFPSDLNETKAAFCAPISVHIDYKIKVIYQRNTANVNDKMTACAIYIWVADRWVNFTGKFDYVYGCHLYKDHPEFGPSWWFKDSIADNKGVSGLKVVSVTKSTDGNMSVGDNVMQGNWHSITVPEAGKEYSDNEDIVVKNSFEVNNQVEIEYSLTKDVAATDYGSLSSRWHNVPILPMAWSFLNMTTNDLVQCIGSSDLNNNVLTISDDHVDEIELEQDDNAESGYTLKMNTSSSDTANQLVLQKQTNGLGNDFEEITLKMTDIIISRQDLDHSFPYATGAPILGNNAAAGEVINIGDLHHEYLQDGELVDVVGFLNHLHYNGSNYIYFSPFEKERTYSILSELPDKSVKIEFECVCYNFEKFIKIGKITYVVLKAETSDFIKFKIEAYKKVK